MAPPFVFTDFVKNSELPADLGEILKVSGFDSVVALKNASDEDLKELKVGPGHRVHIRTAVRAFQESCGGGPLCAPVTQCAVDNHSNASLGVLETLLSRLQLEGGSQAARNTNKGEGYLRIVDFLPAGVITSEEEVALGAGLTLKMSSKPKLEKVSPSAWIVANSRILARLSQDSSFDIQAYLRYSEMIGELGCRFTWQSVILYDDEYRQRQWVEGFAWGTSAPHLSTIILRERTGQQPVPARGGRRDTYPTGQRATNSATAAGRKEACRQFNRGDCSYGTACIYRHTCSTCGGQHPARDHPSSTEATSPQ